MQEKFQVWNVKDVAKDAKDLVRVLKMSMNELNWFWFLKFLVTRNSDQDKIEKEDSENLPSNSKVEVEMLHAVRYIFDPKFVKPKCVWKVANLCNFQKFV